MVMKNPFDFTGKSVILTGAAGGLGRPITIAFAQAGADLALCGRTEEKLVKLAQEIKGSKGQVFYSRVDLCDPKEAENFVKKVCDRYKKIDILVNLVGGIIRKPSIDYLTTFTTSFTQKMVTTSLTQSWLCISKFRDLH